MSATLRWMPFPFPGDRFPDELGAIVQQTVLDGAEPARLLIHDAAGDWAIGDGVNAPNVPGACLATHIRHVLALDSSLGTLAAMPPGSMAERDGAADPWSVRPPSMTMSELHDPSGVACRRGE